VRRVFLSFSPSRLVLFERFPQFLEYLSSWSTCIMDQFIFDELTGQYIRLIPNNKLPAELLEQYALPIDYFEANRNGGYNRNRNGLGCKGFNVSHIYQAYRKMKC